MCDEVHPGTGKRCVLEGVSSVPWSERNPRSLHPYETTVGKKAHAFVSEKYLAFWLV